LYDLEILMLRLSNLADYAVLILVQSTREDSQRLSATRTAAATGLPVPTVAKVTGLLAKAGLITGQRGAGGGFELARPADAISVADIIEAVDGPIALTHCVEGITDCAIETSCQMKAPWQVINRVMKDALGSISLSDLSRAATSPASLPLSLRLDAQHG
jgi:FeS assembly SUF system regulator